MQRRLLRLLLHRWCPREHRGGQRIILSQLRTLSIYITPKRGGGGLARPIYYIRPTKAPPLPPHRAHAQVVTIPKFRIKDVEFITASRTDGGCCCCGDGQTKSSSAVILKMHTGAGAGAGGIFSNFISDDISITTFDPGTDTTPTTHRALRSPPRTTHRVPRAVRRAPRTAHTVRRVLPLRAAHRDLTTHSPSSLLPSANRGDLLHYVYGTHAQDLLHSYVAPHATRTAPTSVTNHTPSFHASGPLTNSGESVHALAHLKGEGLASVAQTQVRAATIPTLVLIAGGYIDHPDRSRPSLKAGPRPCTRPSA